MTMRLKEGMGKAQNEFRGEGRKGIPAKKAFHERKIRSPGIVQNAQPLLLVGFPQGKPFMKLIGRDAISFA